MRSKQEHKSFVARGNDSVQAKGGWQRKAQSRCRLLPLWYDILIYSSVIGRSIQRRRRRCVDVRIGLDILLAFQSRKRGFQRRVAELDPDRSGGPV